jgi:hypothetical protein
LLLSRGIETSEIGHLKRITKYPATTEAASELAGKQYWRRQFCDSLLKTNSLADVIDLYELEPDDAGQVVLRAVREPWPLPPQLRVAPAVVDAIDLIESHVPALAAAGRARLAELENAVEPSWRRRHGPKPPLRSLVAAVPNGTSSADPIVRDVSRQVTRSELWDDRAETDVKQLVALLFVAAEPLTRAEIGKQLGIGQTRLARTCALARPLLGRIGLMLIEDREELSLATVGECAGVVERYLDVAQAEPVSPAALQVLAIVAYEQPVTRADISRIRGVDSDGVVASLLLAHPWPDRRTAPVRPPRRVAATGYDGGAPPLPRGTVAGPAAASPGW